MSISDLEKGIYTDRIIGKIDQGEPGPTVIFIGGIHGNEPSGVTALQDTFEELQSENYAIKGRVYALAGNLKALNSGERFLSSDLNRIWNDENVRKANNGGFSEEETNEETEELLELNKIIQEILNSGSGPFYFLDLHTTSSQGNPFITASNTTLNQDFCREFPIPIVLGIDKFLDGPLLTYTSSLGHVGLGFEAGQHESLSSIENHQAFIWLSLVAAGSLQQSQVEDYLRYHDTLAKTTFNEHQMFEVNFRFGVKEEDEFRMRPGFVNFQSIHADEVLAANRHGDIKAGLDGLLFMPLYQSQGEDGFFIISKMEDEKLNSTGGSGTWTRPEKQVL